MSCLPFVSAGSLLQAGLARHMRAMTFLLCSEVQDSVQDIVHLPISPDAKLSVRAANMLAVGSCLAKCQVQLCGEEVSICSTTSVQCTSRAVQSSHTEC